MLRPAVEAIQGPGPFPGVAQGSCDPGGTWGLDAVYSSWGTHSFQPEGCPDIHLCWPGCGTLPVPGQEGTDQGL